MLHRAILILFMTSPSALLYVIQPPSSLLSVLKFFHPQISNWNTLKTLLMKKSLLVAWTDHLQSKKLTLFLETIGLVMALLMCFSLWYYLYAHHFYMHPSDPIDLLLLTSYNSFDYCYVL